MKLTELKQTVTVPEGVSVIMQSHELKAKGPHGEISRIFNDPKVSVKVEGNSIVVVAKNASKKQKRIIATTKAHIKNMVNGVKNNNEYKLKICSSHFPMQVSLEGTTLIVKNYFGEKVPRKTSLPKDVKVQVQGDKITVTGPDIEKVGDAMSKIEQVCRITNRDRRRFQDGIFLIEKNGKAI
jgi:large subunit ribosomal protein L6